MKEVYKNIYLCEFPLSGNPLKSINIFVIKSRGENLIIDTGFNNEENRKNMDDLIKDLNLDLSKTSLFLTHLHSDHVGLASYLYKKGIKEIYLSEVDGKILDSGSGLSSKQWQNIIKNAKAQGLEDENLDIHEHPGFKNRPQESFPYKAVKENDKLTIGEFNFTLIDEAGHTPGMLGLYEGDKKILFCGDHILGKITPNITWWAEEYGDSLNIYLQNLKKVKKLSIDYLYSSHRFLVDDVNKRIDELINHHKNRLKESLSIVRKYGKISTRDVAKKLNWDIRAKNWNDFPQSQKWFATGEASAHLIYLKNKGLIEEEKINEILYYYPINKI